MRSKCALQVKQFFEMGLVNAVGGCCGSSYPHIAALKDTAKDFTPRKRHGVESIMRISGAHCAFVQTVF